MSETSLSDRLSVEFTENETQSYPVTLPGVSTQNTCHCTQGTHMKMPDTGAWVESA